MGVLRPNRRTAEGLSAFSILLGTCLFFDLSEKRGDALAIEVVRQSAPAGEGIEREHLDGGIGEAAEILAKSLDSHPGLEPVLGCYDSGGTLLGGPLL